MIYFLMSDANIPVLVTNEDVFTVSARTRRLATGGAASETVNAEVS